MLTRTHFFRVELKVWFKHRRNVSIRCCLPLGPWMTDERASSPSGGDSDAGDGASTPLQAAEERELHSGFLWQ